MSTQYEIDQVQEAISELERLAPTKFTDADQEEVWAKERAEKRRQLAKEKAARNKDDVRDQILAQGEEAADAEIKVGTLRAAQRRRVGKGMEKESKRLRAKLPKMKLDANEGAGP